MVYPSTKNSFLWDLAMWNSSIFLKSKLLFKWHATLYSCECVFVYVCVCMQSIWVCSHHTWVWVLSVYINSAVHKMFLKRNHNYSKVLYSTNMRIWKDWWLVKRPVCLWKIPESHLSSFNKLLFLVKVQCIIQIWEIRVNQCPQKVVVTIILWLT